MAEAASIAAALERLARGEGPAECVALPRDDGFREKRAQRRSKRSITLNVISMIDVTFLILVFFVCTTKTLDREEFLRTDLAQRGAALVTPTALALDEPPLRIELLREEGRTRIRVMAPMSQPDSFEQLSSLFASKLYSKENPSGLFPSDHPIELAPAKDVPWDDAVAAFNGLVRAGYQQIHFAGAS
ncbi:MAG: biopolymer transporter ExbD [Planctomycetes bacterium]|nr:biopolymer transporter ExbD [Planctomycetota bacterium]